MRRTIVLFLLLVALVAVLPAQTPDRTQPPKPGPPPALKLPRIQKRALANGLPVWIVERHEVPVAQLSLLVRSGASADPAGKFGVASLTAAMLDEGAGSRSALEIADALDYLGASLSTSGSFDASAVRLWTPARRLADALPIMADVALRPTFPDSDVERLRKERLTSMLQARDDPAAIVSMAFPRILYGPDHRYGIGDAGTPGSLSSLSAADLRAFYGTHYRPDNAALFAVGDVGADALLPLLERAFGAWNAGRPRSASPEGRPGQVSLTEAAQVKQREVFLIDKPGAAQSQIRIGWIGVARSTPDYFPLQVLNTILGGSFTSRLNQNLREEHGYAYGAGSVFVMRLAPGPFYASAGVQTDKTMEALKEFFNELNGMLKPIPGDELAKAKNYVALSFPGDFESSGDIAGRLEEMLVYSLPDDYFAGYVQKIQAVTAADVQRVAQKYIQPDKFVVVVVGDRKVVEQGVRTLNLGPMKVMSVDEALGPAR